MDLYLESSRFNRKDYFSFFFKLLHFCPTYPDSRFRVLVGLISHLPFTCVIQTFLKMLAVRFVSEEQIAEFEFVDNEKRKQL
jgi:hypothetical protein